MQKKIATISLGCDKNRVDTENMLFLLERAGYTLTQDTIDADYLLVNTCGFIDKAKEESIDTIFEMAGIKKKTGAKIIATGCLSERYGNELFESIGEVDAFVGIHSEQNIVNIIDCIDKGERVLQINKEKMPYMAGRVLTTPYHYAYLKIADGCDNFCSYCAIPKIRGRYKSVPLDKLIIEAKSLIEQGVKEIILVAQDTTLYGKDLYDKPSLKELLKELVKLELWKIRILYAYPEQIDVELIEMISKEEKIAKYIDIPLQHIEDSILKRMNRKSNSDNIRALLKSIKSIDSNIAIRTTFIVGFNGETEEKYKVLKEFIEENEEIDYVGFFAYSIEEGTPASKFKDGNIPKKTIDKRVLELEKIWSQKTIRNNQKYIGKKLEVIYEGIDYDKQCFWGRIEQNAPEIDTKVYLKASIPLDIGRVYTAEITAAEFDLYGKIDGEK